MHVVVIGAGPAGIAAAIRAAQQGAQVSVLTDGPFGGMAAHDGPAPVRALAHAARLMREARRFGDYGISVGTPQLNYGRLLTKVYLVTQDVAHHSALHQQLAAAGATLHENMGRLRFTNPHTVVSELRGASFTADRFVLCTGGRARRLSIPGGDLAASHSDAWSLTEVPSSMLIIGAGATGLQVASIFAAFGSQVTVFERGQSLLPGDDPDVAAAVTAGFRQNGIVIEPSFEAADRLEQTETGVRLHFRQYGQARTAEAALCVAAVGWEANTAELALEAAGVALDPRGFIAVDADYRTTAQHIFAAGDVTGQLMLATQALQAGFLAGSAAADHPSDQQINVRLAPMGSFTDPEYASVGFTLAEIGEDRAIAVKIPFSDTTRAIIDGVPFGFCKLVVAKDDHRILGCQVVGDRAVDIVQLAAVAIAADQTVETLARLPFSFPTYAGVLGRCAVTAMFELSAETPPTVVA